MTFSHLNSRYVFSSFFHFSDVMSKIRLFCSEQDKVILRFWLTVIKKKKNFYIEEAWFLRKKKIFWNFFHFHIDSDILLKTQLYHNSQRKVLFVFQTISYFFSLLILLFAFGSNQKVARKSIAYRSQPRKILFYVMWRKKW